MSDCRCGRCRVRVVPPTADPEVEEIDVRIAGADQDDPQALETLLDILERLLDAQEVA